MKKVSRHGVRILFTLALVIVPVAAHAQSYIGGGFRGWFGSGLSDQIRALGTTPPTALPIPVLFGVSVGDLSPNFGDPRDGGARTHKGEDIMAARGTPIVSPVAGVVLRNTTGPSEGNAVYEAIGGGYTLVYMHLDRFAEGVTSGSVVEPGSLIGYVGNTGNAAGGAAHLHFEVHDATGAAVDPMPFLTSEFSADQKASFLSAIRAQTSDSEALDRFVAVSPALSPISAGALAFTRDLTIGMTGEDVRSLQRFLNAHGFPVASSGAGSPGNETAYFGPATKAAVARFQAAHAVAPSVGYVGPLTRAALTLVA